MSTSVNGNDKFTRVRNGDTSRIRNVVMSVLGGMASRQVSAEYVFSTTSLAIASYALSDVQGNQVALTEGDWVRIGAMKGNTITSATSTAEIAVGLAASAGDGQAIAGSILASTVVGTINSPGVVDDVLGPLTTVAQTYLVMTTSVEVITGGVLKVALEVFNPTF
jgi:hypothetical protein